MNFNRILWNRLKEFYKSYNYCNKCVRIISASVDQSRCPECGSMVENIPNLKIGQLGAILESQIIVRNLKIDELYLKMKKLIPDEYSREYRAERGKIKQEFEKLMNFSYLDNSNQENKQRCLF